ncbi:Tph3p KNAG_0B04980 [Huiozyma naganishii CBS 8797]|uniref:Skg3/CAF120-like PH-like domain-containing protein n=1 Tax=Huiozyma naganishii (strain ATCC MYA-139 / BCRC 22969 / CBS 8797 / KCTC 17520 / NBRC 10181 / NCYC 3082 / Yp74L-3) TaxID=1071383 RepID=J7RVH5_HUIN7|nr:hypothetical protein KNAG_0B04980 [Kazachstania naganishii CBS 8797]CCK68932.1 hypothetical protein KNAG_0B04980 [Kazachstania naganishii CBS 8797]
MKFLPDGLRNPVVIKRRLSATVAGPASLLSSGSDSSSLQVPGTPTSMPAPLSPDSSNNISGYSNTARLSTTGLFYDLPPEIYENIKPLLTLFKAQAHREYYSWVDGPSASQWSATFMDGSTAELASLSFVGDTVRIVPRDTNREYTMPLIVGDNAGANYTVEDSRVCFTNPRVTLSCASDGELAKLVKLLSLSVFERISLYKSLTGTVIANMGKHLPDIKIILNSPHNFKDWCEVYLEGTGWVKAWCHINRDARSGKDPKGKCQIKIYTQNRSADPSAASNLVCYIPDCDYIQDIFFYNTADADLDPVSFLQNLNTIRILGDVRYSNEYNNIGGTTGKRKMFSPRRRVSTSSIKLKSATQHETRQTGLLVRPIAHNGLSHLGAMTRFIIPMFDIARKYGRPGKFVTSRQDSDSLMFALPRLPKTRFLAEDQIPGFLANAGTAGGDPLAAAMVTVSEYIGATLST